MSNIAIESKAPALARHTAQRVADGVVASYVRALATASADQIGDPPAHLCDSSPGRPVRRQAPLSNRRRGRTQLGMRRHRPTGASTAAL